LLSFSVVIYSKTKAKSPKAKKAIAGEIGFTTSPSSEAALTAAASRAMRRAGEIPFSCVK